MIHKTIMSVIGATLMLATPALAAGPDGDKGHRGTGVDIRIGDGVRVDVGPKRHGRKHHRYVPGHRYDRAPGHWRRHSHRPRDWRKRGCIIVGPVWFCP